MNIVQNLRVWCKNFRATLADDERALEIVSSFGFLTLESDPKAVSEAGFGHEFFFKVWP